MPSEHTIRRWQQADRLLEQALDRPPSGRRAFLEQATEDDEALREEVLAWLEADSAAGPFLERPVVTPSGTPAFLLPEPSAADLSGQRIGPYRLLEILGHGGMATVYRAQREDEFRRQVAIKVLRGDLPLPELTRRLRVERQVLAQLEHPSIARLYDGGTTPDGRPFLVMELIEGAPIDVHCRRRKLSLEARLRLFVKVCAAVEYAHRNLLVHRDLKPSNILVTADGEPKLLDFGIAKLLDGRRFDLSLDATHTDYRPMTPSFASPEQVRGDAVTTASDVYSLGVVLFHVLTGQSPYRPRSDRAHPAASLLEHEPRKPSEVEASFARQLRGDLDVIVLKALRKEPGRRYGSVRELAEDLDRSLSHRPVLARPETFGYRMVKLLRRHTVASAAVAGLILSIVGFLAVTLLQSGQVARERDLANAERDRARQTTDFLLGLLSSANPEHTLGEDLTVRQVLDRGAARIDRLADQPALQAASLVTIGRVYRELGLADEARPLLERSLELRRRLHGETHLEVAESLRELALLLQDLELHAEAEQPFRESLEMLRQLYGDHHPRVAEALGDLGHALFRQNRYPEAEQNLRLALERTEALAPEQVPVYADFLNNLGLVLHNQGVFEEAERLYRAALERTRESKGTHPDLAPPLYNLAILLQETGRLEPAQALLDESLELRRKVYGDRHPAVARAAYRSARLAHDREDLEQAETLYREALSIAREVPGERSTAIAVCRHLTQILAAEGRQAEGEALLREAVHLQELLTGEPSLETANLLDELAEHLMDDPKRLAEAEDLVRRSLDVDRQILGADHPWVARSEILLARVVLRRGRTEEARRTAERALPVVREFHASRDVDSQREFWAEVVAQAERVLASSGLG